MKNRNFLKHFLRILLGSVFVFSGIIKLYPVEPFELTFIDLGLAGWTSAPVIARLLISFEIFLGLMLISGIFLRSFTLKAVVITLLVFSSYLVYQWITEGNSRNCGCFGTFLGMTPLQALIKNALLLFGVFWIWKNESSLFPSRKWLFILIGLLALPVPFILNPVLLSNIPEATDGIGKDSLDVRLLPRITVNDSVVDYSKGTVVLGFLSLTCPHCKIAAQKLSLISRQQKTPPVYFFLNGELNLQKEFYSETKTSFPFAMFQRLDFYRFTGGELPAFIILKNGKIVKRWNGEVFGPEVFNETDQISK